MRSRSAIPLANIAKFLIGPFGSAFSVENYTEDRTYRYIRGKDVKQMRLMDDDSVFMPKADFERLSRFALKENDLLVSVVGTLGNAALVQKEHTPAIFSCKSTVLRVEKVNPAYLLTYINSKYGRSLLLRKERGAVQKGLNLDDLKTLDVYVATESLQIAIEDVFRQSVKLENQSKATYARAEGLLLEALGLTDFEPSTEAVNVKSFKESFMATGRLDSEHYQVSYDELEELLKNYSGGTTTINDLTESVTNGAEIREYQENGTPYLRIADIKLLDVNAASVVRVNPDLAQEVIGKVALQAGDVLVSRSGSLAVTAVIEPEWINALISSHLIRLRIADSSINPYYLALFLSALPGKMQIQKWSNGGVQPEINQPSLKSIVVPKIPKKVQAKIQDAILEARKLRKRSVLLLEAAKRAVEIAIEENEETALAWLALETKL